MKKVTVSELQKNLQALANQKGANGFDKAKALYLEDLMIVDEAGNPVDPSAIDYQVTLMPAAGAAAETDAMDEDKPEDASKSVAAQVRTVIREEIAKSAPRASKAAVRVESPKMFGRLRNLKSADEAYRFGRWAMGCLGHRKSADWCADHDILVTKGHTENVNTAGGFLVPDEFENSLITLREQFGVFRANARIVPMSSDVKRMPRRTGTVTANFVGEASVGTQSQQTFDQVNLVAKKLMVLSKISSELNEDNVVALGDDLAGEISYAFALKEDQCGFNGDGTSTFGGIVGLLNAIGAGGSSDAGSVTAASGVSLTNLREVVGKLAQWADTANAKWYVRRQEWNSIFLRLAESAGGVTANEIRDSEEGLRFFGYPVVLSQAITAPSGAGATYCYFGDLSLAAYFGDRRSTTVEFSNAALNAFEQDELVVRGTERFDINVANVGDASVAGAMIKATF
jgi:HK97 family phage major capsid protein